MLAHLEQDVNWEVGHFTFSAKICGWSACNLLTNAYKLNGIKSNDKKNIMKCSFFEDAMLPSRASIDNKANTVA
jgi:hypothetical protein